MEHEFEKIRSKIESAEQNPVNWEKELVWSKITQQRSGKSFAFYYAAASFLLAGALFFYALEATKRKEIDLELKAIELSIEEYKLLQTNLMKQNAGSQLVTCADDVANQTEKNNMPVRIKKTGPQKIILPAVLEEEKQQEILNITVAETQVSDVKTTTQVVESVTIAQSIGQVQAIIGVGYEPSGSTVTKDKKLKFRFFRPEDNAESVPAGAETISLQSKLN